MKKALIIILLLSSFAVKSQKLQLSVYSEVSIITVGPTENLHETFGHSALRIKDPLLRLDLVYNYGMFDFDAPNFYSNFAKGRLIYKLGRYQFKYFLESNRQDKRWVKEQVLELTQQEKQLYFEYLEKNVLPENSSYFYDPFFDNCATKLYDITKEILGDKVLFSEDFSKEKHSLRQLMNNEILWNTWGSLGINTALGSKLDKTATSTEYLYLPDYVFEAFNSAKKVENTNSIPFVKKENTLLDFEEIKPSSSLFSPFYVLLLVLLLVAFISYKDLKRGKRTNWLDILLFSVQGIIGLALTFLWLFTDHSTTPNNFNILWALPFHLIFAFFLLRNTNLVFVKKYSVISLVLILVTIIIWSTGIQQFSFTLIPLFGLICIRLFLIKNLLTSKK